MERRRRGVAVAAAALAGTMALAACETDESSLPPCPTVQIVQDLTDLTRFRSGDGRDLTDVVLEARIVNFGGACSTDLDEGAAGVVETEMQVDFSASRGPANRARTGNFRYFVAYSTVDLEIIDRAEFDVDFSFEGNRNTISLAEERLIVIELQEGEAAEDYLIYVGFQLTPGEVAYNRARSGR